MKTFDHLSDEEYLATLSPEERELEGIQPPSITDNPTDVRSIRIKMGLSQGKFAKAFGIPLHTLQNWEAGRRSLSGASLALIKTISLHPEAVKDAVAS